MTSKMFYKSVLSKITPIGAFLIFFFVGLYYKFVDGMNSNFIMIYSLLSIALITLLELLVSFFRTIPFVKKVESQNKRRAVLYLLYIPYLPSIIAIVIFSLCSSSFSIKNLRITFVFIFSIISSINYIFSIILNCKLNIFYLIPSSPPPRYI